MMNHPYILKYIDDFEEDDARYLVMEYCDSGTLQ